MQDTDSFKELAEDIKKRTDSDTLNRWFVFFCIVKQRRMRLKTIKNWVISWPQASACSRRSRQCVCVSGRLLRYLHLSYFEHQHAACRMQYLQHSLARSVQLLSPPLNFLLLHVSAGNTSCVDCVPHVNRKPTSAETRPWRYNDREVYTVTWHKAELGG